MEISLPIQTPLMPDIKRDKINKIKYLHYENMPIQIYTENFTIKYWNFSDKKFWHFFLFLLKT